MKHNYHAVLERVEQVRIDHRLNKSRFSERIGIKPQTYNNFIGAQGSKPSVQLLMGVSDAFGVSMDWLCFGRARALNIIEVKREIAALKQRIADVELAVAPADLQNAS